jgi:AAA family ATP:ADP antiporter
MKVYSQRFPPTTHHYEEPDDRADAEDDATLWSGVILILKHNYVLLILGVSCLYEVSLTCLNYQMTLLGWNRFEETSHEGMSFVQFMGHYGQMVNIFSLGLSSLAFPLLIRRLGLKRTLRIFPALLLVVNFIAFGAIPGNLAVLFLSMALLKAMTYSIHDPSKEILYLPTSNAIKFKSKFWIDVVGARIAKAIGSSINRIAGSVDRSIRIASFPSLVTSMMLLYVCYQAGMQFDRLIATESIVGVTDFRIKREYGMVDEDGRLIDDDEEDDDIFENPTTPNGRDHSMAH